MLSLKSAYGEKYEMKIHQLISAIYVEYNTGVPVTNKEAN